MEFRTPQASKSRTVHFYTERKTPAKRIVEMASTVALEINKISLKLRRSLNGSPFFGLDSNRKASREQLRRSAKIIRNNQLCSELSSFGLYPLFGAMSPSHLSTPNLLFLNEQQKKKFDLEELSEPVLLMILRRLDEHSLRKFTQTCKRVRLLAKSQEDNLGKVEVFSHEIRISKESESKMVHVRALKQGRSLDDVVIEATCLEAVLAPHTTAFVKITFDTHVNVAHFLPEILRLYESRKLAPLSLAFTGGSLTKRNEVCGADLRKMTESSFVEFVKKLQPHLQEVQFATSRMFKTTRSPPILMGLILDLSTIGIVYERPALRFLFEDLKKVISYWKHETSSRSCEVYIRRPFEATMDEWKNLGKVEAWRKEPLSENGELIVDSVTIGHSFLLHVELIFRFH